MKKAKDLMTTNPICTTPDGMIPEIAKKMKKHDFGEIPVVDNLNNLKPIGVVTDRDIVMRIVAEDKTLKEARVEDCMTKPSITAKEDTSVEDCRELMRKNQIRRLPIVNESGKLVGMVSQADIALHENPKHSGQMLKDVSKAA